MKIILFGVSEFSKSIDLYLTRESNFEVIAYTASRDSRSNQEDFNGRPFCCFENIQTAYPPSDYKMFVAIGYVNLNSTRRYFIEKATEKGYSLISHVSPSCIFFDDLKVGKNVFIFEGNIIQPNVRIEDGVIIGRGNSVGHDSQIHSYSFLANRTVLCGKCIIGKESFIGSNATISDGVSIAEKNLIGANSLIRKSTNPSEVYIQESTKKISKKSNMFFRW